MNDEVFYQEKALKKIKKYGEIQEAIYEIKVETIRNVYDFIISTNVIKMNDDIIFLIKTIVYGCKIRPFQIASLAHLCLHFHLLGHDEPLSYFKKYLRSYLLHNLTSYNNVLFLYELQQNGFFDSTEVIYIIHDLYNNFGNSKKLTDILLFYGPEIHENSVIKWNFMRKNILKNNNNESIKISRYIRYIEKSLEINSKSNFQYYRVNGNTAALFNILAMDDLEELQRLPNFLLYTTFKEKYYNRFKFLNYQSSPLMVAAYFDSIKCFEYLLEQNADIDFKDKRDRNVIMAAIAGGAMRVFSYLIQNTNLPITEQECKVALQYHQNQILRIIVSSVNPKIEKGIIIYYSLKYNNLSFFYEYSSPLLNKINLPKADKKNSSALMLSAKNGIPEVVYIVLTISTDDIFSYNNDNLNALSYAVESRNLRTVKIILDHFNFNSGSSVKKNKSPPDPLESNEDSRHSDAKTPLEGSQNHKQSSKHEDFDFFSVICHAAKCSTPEIVDLLVSISDYGINHRDSSGKGLLIYACSGSNKKVVKFLLQDERINVNLKTPDGNTPLFEACRVGSNSIFELLFWDIRTDIEATDAKRFNYYI